jgi:uncharacterized protein (TIGR00255 family)
MNSMTGFGRAEGVVGSYQFSVEAKSVNHRYLDVRYRLPPIFSLYEIALGELVRSRFERGSFELGIKQKLTGSGNVVSGGSRFLVDEAAARSLIEGCAALHQKFKTEKSPTLEMMALTNRIFIPVEEGGDTEALFQGVRGLVERALGDLGEMRRKEGARLKEVLAGGVRELQALCETAATLAPEHPKKIAEKLSTRIAGWNLATPPDAQRLEWEIAFFADRADITEEINRLRIHASEFARLLEEKKPVGRRLDFLTQELHREVNTMGSKSGLIEITRLTLEAKTLIEKLREQVQNVE